MDAIYHLVPSDYWRRLDPSAPYLPREFEHDGFIHCTRGLSLMFQVANTFYRRVQGDFLLLTLDAERLSAEVRYEGGFPHIYGPLNWDAIVAVRPLVRRSDGSFDSVGE